MNEDLLRFSSFVTTVATLLVLGLYVILGAVLAQSTANDVDRLRTSGREPQILGSVGWAFFVLITNVVGFAIYWVMHYSSWRDASTDRQTTQRSNPRPARD